MLKLNNAHMVKLQALLLIEASMKNKYDPETEAFLAELQAAAAKRWPKETAALARKIMSSRKKYESRKRWQKNPPPTL